MKKIYKYMAVLALAVLLGSCGEDFLEQEPSASVPIATAITDVGELQTAVYGMYASLRTSNAYGRTIPVLGDLMADNTFVAPSNSGRYLVQNVYRTIASTREPGEIWTALYNTILRANAIIEADIASTATVDQLKGEAYAVRALAYHELVKFFATPYTVNPNALGVPIVTEFDPNNPTDYYVNQQPERNTVAEVYTQIISDYQMGFDMMGDRFINSSYMNKWAARALQARAYLFMGDYQKAKETSLDVVMRSGFETVSASNYLNYWTSAAPVTSRTETLFEISNDNIDNNGSDALTNIYDQGGYGDILATADLVSLYEEGDVRGTDPSVPGVPVILIDSRSDIDPAYVVNKYQNRTNPSDRDDIKVIRYAEVMLTLAESYARTGEFDLALDMLNQLMEARNASTYSSTDNQLIEDIITERRKELAFEGHRFWTLSRLNRPIVRTAEQPASTALIDVNNFRRILPIPQAEIDANPNIEQNPGY
ncbi:RagB/SusD family nutrient uptake outer membrane protein [Pontibacter sp. MBLB2868]|uniref:RagB/SusD family nutrient uptake outer membrane protein n=1 Tax=Pontibacter sp. MBLB2868 TaxID=3451555 RepID=UPI003F753401